MGRPRQTPFHVRKTTLLPPSLRDELVAAGKLSAPKNADPSKTASTSVVGRKQRRKDERKKPGQFRSQPTKPAAVQQKPKGSLARAPADGSSSSNPSKGKGRQVEPDGPSTKATARGSDAGSKKRKRVSFSESSESKDHQSKTKVQRSDGAGQSEGRKADGTAKTPLQRLLEKTETAAGSSRNQSRSGNRTVAIPNVGNRSQAEKDEDDEIAWLEAKLGIRSNPNARKELQEDGLDDLLDDLDRLDEEIFGSGSEAEAANEGGEEQESSDDEGSAESDMDQENTSADEDQLEEEIDDLAELDTSEAEEQDDSDQAIADEEWKGIPSHSSASRSDASPKASASSPAATSPTGATPSKYVPPALRKALAADAASSSDTRTQDPRLRRILLGLLNRLSPTSFPMLVLNPSETNSLHSIYMGNSRGVVNELLVDLILEIVSAQGEGIGDTQIVVLAALVKVLSTGLVGGMNASGGKEVAASTIDGAIRRMDASSPEDDKEKLNLVSFLSQLYNFQVFAAGLVYDLIREFIEQGLRESDVESLLRVIKVSGSQLRHDDPTALKQIVQLVSEVPKATPASSQSSRTKFMIESLTNLRNNKIKPATGVAAEAESSLKKFIANLAKKGASVPTEPLRISLKDIRAASSKGKWWLVGAAWSGNPLVDIQNEAENAIASVKTDATSESNTKEARLMKLAKKQGMNTDVRRRIFVALMSGEDYIDATSKLLGLSLTEVQQREIMRVLLHCLGNERAYNPYYTLVVSRLLSSSPTSNVHSYQITLQYALWDFFRALGETEVGGAEMVKGASVSAEDISERRVRNTARAFAWWVAKNGLSLSILKPLPFGTLLPSSRAFLAQFFSALIKSTQCTSPLLTTPTSGAALDASSLQAPFYSIVSTHPGVIQGIVWFLQQKEMRRDKDEIVRWGVPLVTEALESALL